MKRRGFTLIETALVASLLVVLVYAGTVSFLRAIPKFRLQAGIWEITTSLNQARFRAIWSGTAHRVSFHPTGYEIERHNDEEGTWEREKAATIPGVEIQANNAPVFHPGGTVSGLASIYVSNGRGTYKITVAISGRVKTTKIS